MRNRQQAARNKLHATMATPDDYWFVEQHGTTTKDTERISDLLIDTPLIKDHEVESEEDVWETLHNSPIHKTNDRVRLCISYSFVGLVFFLLFLFLPSWNTHVQTHSTNHATEPTHHPQKISNVEVHVCKHLPVKSISFVEHNGSYSNVHVKCGWFFTENWRMKHVFHCGGMKAMKRVHIDAMGRVVVECTKFTVLQVLSMRRRTFDFHGLVNVHFKDGNSAMQFLHYNVVN